MNIELLHFTFFYFLIILSCIGFGFFFSFFTKFNHKEKNIGLSGLVGLFFLIIYSYFSHFFYPHNSLHNFIIILIGIIFFILFVGKYEIKKLILATVVFFVLFLSFLIFKNNYDFTY